MNVEIVFRIAAFGIILAALLVRGLIKCRDIPKSYRWLIILLSAALLFQTFASLIPNGVVWCHIMIMIALFSAYNAAKSEC